jgi:hypothetical protein
MEVTLKRKVTIKEKKFGYKFESGQDIFPQYEQKCCICGGVMPHNNGNVCDSCIDNEMHLIDWQMTNQLPPPPSVIYCEV